MNAPIRVYEAHPAANLFPMMDEARLQELAADIAANGQIEPIRLFKEKILDGRNRYQACASAGVEPKFSTVPDDVNPWQLVWSLNGERRDITKDQRYIAWKACAENSAEWQADREHAAAAANKARAEAAAAGNVGRAAAAKKDDGAFSGATNSGTTKKPNRASDEKAAAANVDRGTVERIDWLEKNRPDLLDTVRSGETTASRAYTQAKKEEKVAKLTDIAAQEVKAAQGVYDVIVLDPPWQMEKIEREVAPNQAAFDYPTMDEAQLSQMEIPASDDCHVWVWTTHKHFPMALRLLEAWGLKYVCTFVWHKPGGFQPFGLPQYNCEFAVYARKGAPTFIDLKAFPVCFNAPRGEHSEKPQEFYDIVSRVTAGRRLDMFNRRKIEGFDGWGNEAPQ